MVDPESHTFGIILERNMVLSVFLVCATTVCSVW